MSDTPNSRAERDALGRTLAPGMEWFARGPFDPRSEAEILECERRALESLRLGVQESPPWDAGLVRLPRR